MSLETIKPISLDLYNNVITSINAKQLDTQSRYVKIACTENGKKLALKASEVKAFIRYKKPDGFSVLNEATVTDDGCILIEFTQQMLAVSGRANADVILIDSTKTDTEINKDTDFSTLKTSILSTMYLNVSIHGSPINESEIESSYEYNALLQTMTRMVTVEAELYEFKETVEKEETKRQANETNRVNSEKDRADAEQSRKAAFDGKILECDTVISGAQTATENANTATKDLTTVKANAVSATDSANAAAERAIQAAQNCEKMTDVYLAKAGGTVTGTLVLSKNTDLSGTANNSPALIVGGEVTEMHIEVDGDEIHAKSNANTASNLWLNKDGGTVNVGSGGLVSNGDINATGSISTPTSFTIGDFVLTFDGTNKRLVFSNV